MTKDIATYYPDAADILLDYVDNSQYGTMGSIKEHTVKTERILHLIALGLKAENTDGTD